VRKAQNLEQKRAKHLNPDSVANFYGNLKKLYETHNYPTHHIWNCDESGAQVGKDGGGYVLAQKGCKTVHKKVTPDQREWITVVSCVNARGNTIPNFFIFKGKRNFRNYLTKTGKKGAVQVMQSKAWMTNALFVEWILHFLLNLSKDYGISQTNRHLLILDGHKSHVSLHIIRTAMARGLDLLTFLPIQIMLCSPLM